MVHMEATDPRVDAIIDHTPFLKMVGTGTIGRILQVAEELGFIPEADTRTVYGIDYRADGGSVYEAAGGLKSATDINDAGSVQYPIVRRDVTTYRTRTTEWIPVNPVEENHV